MTPERTRELLENCAKACGIEYVWDETLRRLYLVNGSEVLGEFNPTESSADYSEMEAKLRMDVEWHDLFGFVKVGGIQEMYSMHPTPQLARMMAGCLAAEADYLERGK